MPLYPRIRTQLTEQELIDSFGGYDHRLRIADGTWYDTENLSSDLAPMLGVRRPRGNTHLRAAALLEKDALAYVSESGTLYYFNKKGKGKKSTGWFKQNGHKYYFKNGKRYKGTKKVKKTWYQFSPEDGKVWWEIGDDVDKKIQSYGSNTRYLIIVKLKEHRVRVYERTDGRWKKIHRWKCTTGKKSTPTPKGTFHIGVKGLHFNTGERSRCWYYTQFYGSYMFHSVLYDRQPRPVNCTRGTLGASLSHGCIRLKLSDAKWLQDHVSAGTKVVIY